MRREKLKINILDLLVLATLFFSTTGYIFAKAEKIPLNKIIEGKEDIAIEILLPDVYSVNGDLFHIGDKSAITIRNRPYTKLKIIKSEPKPKIVLIPSLNGSYKTVYDPLMTNLKDYTVTLRDFALKTNDGYVIGGNKIKIGNPIELEGFNYRLTGKVIDIYPLMLNE